MSDRPDDRLVSPHAHASARKRANTGAETRQATTATQSARDGPLSGEEQARIRQAGADDARRSRVQQGLPERIEDPVAIAVLAALLRTANSTRTQENESDKNSAA